MDSNKLFNETKLCFKYLETIHNKINKKTSNSPFHMNINVSNYNDIFNNINILWIEIRDIWSCINTKEIDLFLINKKVINNKNINHFKDNCKTIINTAIIFGYNNWIQKKHIFNIDNLL